MSCQCRSLPLSATSPLSLPSMANNFLPLSASSHVKHWTQMRNIVTWVKELAWSIWNYMIQSLGNFKLSWVFRKSLVKGTGQNHLQSHHIWSYQPNQITLRTIQTLGNTMRPRLLTSLGRNNLCSSITKVPVPVPCTRRTSQLSNIWAYRWPNIYVRRKLNI
jgi:hypothetical protein